MSDKAHRLVSGTVLAFTVVALMNFFDPVVVYDRCADLSGWDWWRYHCWML
jgi:hypothetical protein